MRENRARESVGAKAVLVEYRIEISHCNACFDRCDTLDGCVSPPAPAPPPPPPPLPNLQTISLTLFIILYSTRKKN